MFTCPVCFFDQMPDPARDYNICPCCGTEFENDDFDVSHDELRNRWVAAGAQWFFRDSAPSGWNPWKQLLVANVGFLPYYSSLTFYGGGPTFRTELVPEGPEETQLEEREYLALAS